jgi:glycosyltransferase involved in cell wall biosynthesis
MKIAVVHDWLITYGGAERTLEQILKVYPEADLFALYDFIPENARAFIQNKRVTTSFLQRFPFARSKYRSYLPLMPLAVEQLDLSGYDVVISSSYACAKGVITGPDQLHISYVYSPIRYAWDMMHQYLRQSDLERGPKSWFVRYVLHRIRLWDYRTAAGVDEFIAISDYIARRIQKVYRRHASVIYPPVDVDAIQLQEQKEDFYLTASRMVPYKRMDLIAEAFSHLPDKRLVIIGDGPEFKRVKAKAGPNVTLLGYQTSDILKSYMRRARAFVFAAEEDFGIVPLEAQASGTPVIAFGKGGCMETVRELETGMFFDRQEPEAIAETIRQFEARLDRFDPAEIRQHALKFSADRFRREFKQFVDRAIHAHLVEIDGRRKQSRSVDADILQAITSDQTDSPEND